MISLIIGNHQKKKWKIEIEKLADKEMNKLKKYHDKMKKLAGKI